jgi:hypothetical protein
VQRIKENYFFNLIAGQLLQKMSNQTFTKAYRELPQQAALKEKYIRFSHFGIAFWPKSNFVSTDEAALSQR